MKVRTISKYLNIILVFSKTFYLQSSLSPSRGRPYNGQNVTTAKVVQRPYIYNGSQYCTSATVLQRPLLYIGPDVQRPWFTTALIYNSPYCTTALIVQRPLLYNGPCTTAHIVHRPLFRPIGKVLTYSSASQI